MLMMQATGASIISIIGSPFLTSGVFRYRLVFTSGRNPGSRAQNLGLGQVAGSREWLQKRGTKKVPSVNCTESRKERLLRVLDLEPGRRLGGGGGVAGGQGWQAAERGWKGEGGNDTKK